MTIIPFPKKSEIHYNEDNNVHVISRIELPEDCDDRISKYTENLLLNFREKNTSSLNACTVKINYIPTMNKNDEYRIKFQNSLILLDSGSYSGIFYGLQTLTHLCNSPKGLPQQGYIHDYADISMRIQHIDLKRLGWNFDYLTELIKFFASMKINFILLEYEDKFPFEFCDKIPVEDAFSLRQINILEQTAYNNFIKIIPLVQCIGHFEYILKYEKYADLRENRNVSSQACPMNPGTFELFTRMAYEVMEAHPSTDYFHVGADEPFLLGTCPICKAEAEKYGKGRLYANYLNKVLSWVNAQGKKPLFWADIIEHYDDAADLCIKDSIAVEWNYEAASQRSEIIKFYQMPEAKLNAERYSSVFTENMHKRFDKYLDFNREKGDFISLPFGKYLKDLGFDVISASNVNNVDNVLTHSYFGVKDSLLGCLATYWASANSDRPPYTLFETRTAGTGMLAASAWNHEYELINRSSFFERYAAFTGGNSFTAGAYEIFNECRHLIVCGDNNDKDESFFERVKDISMNAEVLSGRYPDIITAFITKMEIEKELSELRDILRKSPLLRDEAFLKINLTEKCNERFANTEKIPGWSRIPNNDLRFFPKGEVCFHGVPFSINEDSVNPEEKSLIMIGNYPELKDIHPSAMYGIKIDSPAWCIAFIHAHIEGKATPSGYYGKYILHYSDGEREEIPLVYARNVGEWWNIVEIEEAWIAWSGKNLRNAKVGLHFYPYFPGNKEKKITDIDFICESETTLALAGITLIPNQPDKDSFRLETSLSTNIQNLNSKFKVLKNRMNSEFIHLLSEKGTNEVMRLAFSSVFKYFEWLGNFIK